MCVFLTAPDWCNISDQKNILGKEPPEDESSYWLSSIGTIEGSSDSIITGKWDGGPEDTMKNYYWNYHWELPRM